MADIKSIEGGKKAKAEVLMCPHCNEVPADDHANWSCPRIAGVEVTEGIADGYAYVDPFTWEQYKKLSKANKE